MNSGEAVGLQGVLTIRRLTSIAEREYLLWRRTTRDTTLKLQMSWCPSKRTSRWGSHPFPSDQGRASPQTRHLPLLATVRTLNSPARYQPSWTGSAVRCSGRAITPVAGRRSCLLAGRLVVGGSSRPGTGRGGGGDESHPSHQPGAHPSLEVSDSTVATQCARVRGWSRAQPVLSPLALSPCSLPLLAVPLITGRVQRMHVIVVLPPSYLVRSWLCL